MKKSCFTLFLFVLFTLRLQAQLSYSFVAQSGSFSPLTAATVATLTESYPGTRTNLDESFANNISLGFKFQYNGLNYSQIHLNSNGFASLGAAFVANSTADMQYDQNELRSAAGFKGVIRPVLAPFWDNLALTSSSGISYKTEGTSPNRIFTAQWLNMAWQTGSAAISFQLKLYETSNFIEFVYRQESGASSGPSASIGLTTASVNPLHFEVETTTFISLTSTATTPTANTTTETETLNVKPATGQIYRFTPVACAAPAGLHSTGYTSTTARLHWTALSGATGYQYAVSNLEVPPNTWTATADTSVNLSSLTASTNYFFYVRNQCGTDARMFKFKTPNLASLPYSEGFEAALDNALPRNIRQENLSSQFADVFWQTTDLLPAATGGSKSAVNSSPFVSAQTWLYTPGLALTAGKSYRIGFKYATTGGTQGFEVKYGQQIGAAFMTNSVFNRNDLSNTSYRDTTLMFSPPSTGTYFVGFLYKSAPNNHVFLLDDLSISVVVFPCNDNPPLANYGAGTSLHVKATNIITATNKISGGTDILYQAGKAVVLNPGFEARSGAVFKAQIGGCN